MRRLSKVFAAALLTTAMAMLGVATPAWATSGSYHHGGDHHINRVQVVSITDGDPRPSVSNTWLSAGRIQFDISTESAHGRNVTLFTLKPGAQFADVAKGLQEEFSPDGAQGTRDLVKAADFHGLADVQPGSPVTVTQRLDRGTYYVFSLDASAEAIPPLTMDNVTVLHVGKGDRSSNAASERRLPRIKLTSDDRFKVSGQLPASGSVQVRNVSDTIHIMAFQPVQPGTTDEQVQAYFESDVHDPPAFAADGPSIGMSALSPGNELVMSYALPKGTYVLLCFVADDETGMPHALMGMHKVVTLS